MAKPRADWARAAAEREVERLGIDELPVDPFGIAAEEEITVEPKPGTARGVSGMLVKSGDSFGIMYATDIESEGFQRFSVGHELGHYFLDDHADQIFRGLQTIHTSRAGFASTEPHEIEADHFAAGLLMPRQLFKPAMLQAGDGFQAIERLAAKCETSLTATAIQYAKFSDLPVAVVVSEGPAVCYAFMSDPFKQIRGVGDWLRKGQPVPKDTPTSFFNRDPRRVEQGERREESSTLASWFNGETNFEINEDIVGLGSYDRTLTVLFPADPSYDAEYEDEHDEWDPPTFHRSRRR